MRRLFLTPVFLGVLLLLAVLPIVPAQALQPIHVTTSADELNSDGDCSLREAIHAANSNSVVDACPKGGIGGVDTIFVPDDFGTYVLTIPGANEDYNTEGDLDVTADGMLNPSSVDIIGDGAVTTIIEATGLGDRVFHIQPGNTATISGLTIRKGSAVTLGGGIYNGGTLTLNSSTVSNNTTTSGGSGGGIYTSGTLAMNGSTVTDNYADDDGGGIYTSGTLFMDFSTVSDNTNVGQGGGIYNSGTLDMIRSTVSGNRAFTVGGGIANHGTLTLLNSTISENLAFEPGAGIFTSTSTATLKFSTVADNFDPSFGNLGGGISGPATVDNTVIARNAFSDCVGVVPNSIGYNLTSDSSCQFNSTGDFVDPYPAAGLGPLANYGGPTKTQALLSGSPAIDNAAFPACGGVGGPELSDQRNAPRPFGPRCDIGAFEFGAKPQRIGLAVGGIVELRADGAEAPALAASGSGSPEVPYAALAGGIAAVVLALAAGGWYARRRWLR